jgi:hypothetical protein
MEKLSSLGVEMNNAQYYFEKDLIAGTNNGHNLKTDSVVMGQDLSTT